MAKKVAKKAAKKAAKKPAKKQLRKKLLKRSNSEKGSLREPFFFLSFSSPIPHQTAEPSEQHQYRASQEI